ncbi:MAG: class II 3-deoxy-7-phosphoheptulonate synthase [Planctomycetota bacterium]
MPVAASWSTDSWHTCPAPQQPDYPDAAAVKRAVAKLRRLPPLVTSWEIETLRSQLAEAQEGRRFVLQGGDCAESLDDCHSQVIANKLKILLQMSLVLVIGARKSVVRLGRFAGQYAKPRSSPTETRNGVTLPSYFGDAINAPEFTPEARTPDPHLLVRAYQHSALTLNFIRALIDGGFADLHHPEYWDLGFFEGAPARQQYENLVERISEAIRFMETISGSPIEELSRVEFFTSHEGLNLLYESSGTRTVPRREGHYNLTTHFPWIGERTRQLDGAHIEFFRGIRNPIGVKIGPKATADDVTQLCEQLNPENEPGRLTLIHRFGSEKIADALPPLIETVRSNDHRVLWISDPMHGNTTSTRSGQKTRHVDSILSEIDQAFSLHEEHKSVLGGVHFELTGDDVTECIGGARNLTEADLTRNYRSQCDPRLNYEQSLELAFLIAARLDQRRGGQQ